MTLKTFWEAVEAQLAVCSTDELRAILRAIAQETPPSDRQRFLQKLQRTQGLETTLQDALSQVDLLADIADLAQELHAEMEGAEAWEEDADWGEYDDEDSLGPYEAFLEPIVGLLERAQGAFDLGDFPLARAAYQKLFTEVLDQEDEYGRGVHAGDLSINIPEAGARFLRSVYETEPLSARPETLFAQMLQVQSLTPFQPGPKLDDLIQITPRPLPDQESFFAAWIAYLKRQQNFAADLWLREAVWLSQGTAGLEKLAREEGDVRPRAYLDWFTALSGEGKYAEVLRAAQEALARLPANLPIRAAIADHLCKAAAQTGDSVTLRAGRWQAFLAKPTPARLLDLWEAAPSGQERITQMHQAAHYLQGYLKNPPGPQGLPSPWERDNLERFASVDLSLLAHAHLLGHEFEAAHELAARATVLGWSRGDNVQSLVIPFFLVSLSGKRPDQLPPNLKKLWEAGLQAGTGSLWEQSQSLPERMARAYTESLAGSVFSTEQQEKFLSWCVEMAMQRAAAIISNQHRKSYHKAAQVVVACAEALRLRGNGAQAERLIADIRSRFPRHSAFQAELKQAVQQS